MFMWITFLGTCVDREGVGRDRERMQFPLSCTVSFTQILELQCWDRHYIQYPPKKEVLQNSMCQLGVIVVTVWSSWWLIEPRPCTHCIVATMMLTVNIHDTRDCWLVFTGQNWHALALYRESQHCWHHQDCAAQSDKTVEIVTSFWTHFRTLFRVTTILLWW